MFNGMGERTSRLATWITLSHFTKEQAGMGHDGWFHHPRIIKLWYGSGNMNHSWVICGGVQRKWGYPTRSLDGRGNPISKWRMTWGTPMDWKPPWVMVLVNKWFTCPNMLACFASWDKLPMNAERLCQGNIHLPATRFTRSAHARVFA